MSKRKRFNPLEEKDLQSMVDPTTQALEALESGQGLEAVQRIERLRPSQMMPDRFQPRRLLPGAVRQRFFAGQIDCYQAAGEWLALAARDPAWRERVDELLAMGASFAAHGQIKPITGRWVAGREGEFVFEIETGERRFWAACLWAVKEGLKEEPWLRVEVVDRPSRERQVLENRHAQSPSAVSQACEIAALILASMGVEPDPKVGDEFDYFRQAARMRVPRGTWPRLEPIMQLSTRRMQQLLALLNLPSPLLELADRHRVPERVLREVLALPPARWERALQRAIRQGMTAEQVEQARKAGAGRKGDDALRQPERVAFQGLRRFVRAVLNAPPEMQEEILAGVADQIMVEGLDEGLLDVMEALVRRLQARRRRL